MSQNFFFAETYNNCILWKMFKLQNIFVLDWDSSGPGPTSLNFQTGLGNPPAPLTLKTYSLPYTPPARHQSGFLFFVEWTWPKRSKLLLSLPSVVFDGSTVFSLSLSFENELANFHLSKHLHYANGKRKLIRCLRAASQHDWASPRHTYAVTHTGPKHTERNSRASGNSTTSKLSQMRGVSALHSRSANLLQSSVPKRAA